MHIKTRRNQRGSEGSSTVSTVVDVTVLFASVRPFNRSRMNSTVSVSVIIIHTRVEVSHFLLFSFFSFFLSSFSSSSSLTSSIDRLFVVFLSLILSRSSYKESPKLYYPFSFLFFLHSYPCSNGISLFHCEKSTILWEDYRFGISLLLLTSLLSLPSSYTH